MGTRGGNSDGGWSREREKEKRKASESSSQRHPAPNLMASLTKAQLQFIDKEAEVRYLIFIKKNVIIQCVFVENKLRMLKLDLICDKFSKQSWDNLLYFNDKSYPEMLYTILCQSEKRASSNQIVSRVNGIDIKFDRKIVNHVFNCKPKNDPPISRFFSGTSWATFAHKFNFDDLKSFFSVSFNSATKAKPSTLDSMHNILFGIVCNVLSPTFGHRKELNMIELYLF